MRQGFVLGPEYNLFMRWSLTEPRGAIHSNVAYVDSVTATRLEHWGFTVEWGPDPVHFYYGGAFISRDLFNFYLEFRVQMDRASTSLLREVTHARVSELLADETKLRAFQTLKNAAQSPKDRDDLFADLISGRLFNDV